MGVKVGLGVNVSVADGRGSGVSVDVDEAEMMTSVGVSLAEMVGKIPPGVCVLVSFEDELMPEKMPSMHARGCSPCRKQ